MIERDASVASLASNPNAGTFIAHRAARDTSQKDKRWHVSGDPDSRSVRPNGDRWTRLRARSHSKIHALTLIKPSRRSMAQEPSTQPIAMKNPHTNHTKMESSETAWYMISPRLRPLRIIEQAAQQWREN